MTARFVNFDCLGAITFFSIRPSSDSMTPGTDSHRTTERDVCKVEFQGFIFLFSFRLSSPIHVRVKQYPAIFFDFLCVVGIRGISVADDAPQRRLFSKGSL